MKNLKNPLTFFLLMTLITPVIADPTDWHDVMGELGKRRFALEDEQKAIKDQLKIVEEQAKIQNEHEELLKARLAAINEKLASSSRLPTPPGTETRMTAKTTAAGETTDYQKKETELIARSAGRMLILEGKDGSPGAAFLAPQEGKIRIFVSAQWLDKNPRPSVSDLDRSPLPISEELSCPMGIDLVALHPKAPDLPHFELAPDTEKPALGARVVVIFVDPETKLMKGIGGGIRGIGPDTLELDADLTQEMTGAPVLALDSGRVIGIVAPQVAGVADEWAIGTRHQGNRNFAARIDRIKEWKTSDLGRFANEAAFIDGINQRTRIAWLAHMLVTFKFDSSGSSRGFHPGMNSQGMQSGLPGSRKDDESIEDYEKRRKIETEERERRRQFVATVREEARENAANPHIARVTSWLSDPMISRADQMDRLSGIYRSILTDLKKQEPDLSGHMTWYHQQQYRIALENRSDGIRVIGENANRVGQ